MMALLVLALLASASSLFPPPVAAQAGSEEAEITAVIERLFDGMRQGDSAMVRSVFHPEARLSTVGMRNGQPTLRVDPIEGFVEAVGGARDVVWDERIWDLEIRVDGRLATAWMNYAFFAGDQFSHCGVNAVQLFGGADGWQIIQITDTRRREGCELPPDLRAEG